MTTRGLRSCHVAIAVAAAMLAPAGAVSAQPPASTDPVPVPITYGKATDIPMPAAFHVFSARPVDWDGDGRIDLLAAPATGGAVYLLRNIGTSKVPRFDFPFGRPPLVCAPPTRWTLFDAIDDAQAAAAPRPGGGVSEHIGRTFDAADLDGDGKVDLVLSRGGRVSWLRNTGTPSAPSWAAPQALTTDAGAPVAFADMWHTVNPEAVDWDGDGLVDLLCGVWHPSGYAPGDIRLLRDRSAYGTTSAHVYWLRNTGTARSPRFAAPVALTADTGVLAGLGIPLSRTVDWDGDGDLDLMVAYYDASIRFYENTGTRRAPRLVSRGLLEADGAPIASAEGFRPDPVFGDADADLIVAGHGRAVLWFENVGTRRQARLAARGGLPVAAAATTPLHMGNIVTPVTHDVDGDGDRDMLAGNEPGVFLWAENTGTDRQPVFAAAVPLLRPDGRPVELFSKDLGMSMWGPLEDWDERTSPVPVDWNGDGLWDIVTNTMSGRVYWLANAGTRTAPRFEAPRPVQTHAGPLVSLPRSRAGIADWNGDDVPDVVLPDDRGVMTIWYGTRHEGEVKLTRQYVPRSLGGDAIVPQPTLASVESGRLQHEVVDWDGDGRLDVLVSRRSDTTPRRFRVTWYRNVGTREVPVLDGRPLLFDVRSGHEAGLHAVDWDGDGVLDVLTGDQEGRVWWWNGRQLPRSDAAPAKTGQGR